MVKAAQQLQQVLVMMSEESDLNRIKGVGPKTVELLFSKGIIQ